MTVAFEPVVESEQAARALAEFDRDRGDLVDEQELERLRDAAEGRWPADWQAVLALRDGRICGYGAVDTAKEAGDAAGFDGADTLAAVLRHLAEHHPHVAVWARQVGPPELEAAARAGVEPARRLAVLVRELDGPIQVPDLDGVEVEPFVSDMHDEAVVDVLDAAYRDTADGPWDHDRFASRTATDWFRPEDLLLVRDETGIVGVHWMKRRSKTQGEVYNLAVHPRAHGRGIGGLLLLAGLAHLGREGMDEVVLWVDRKNEAAVALYERHGFALAWDDVLFVPVRQPSSGPREVR